jgi:hypothetical protein
MVGDAGLVPKAANGAAVERHQRPPACKGSAMTLFNNYLYYLHTDYTHFFRANITPFFYPTGSIGS